MSSKPLKKNGLQRSMTFCKSALLSGYNMSSSHIASYMEHPLHIACKHFVEGVAPTSLTAIVMILCYYVEIDNFLLLPFFSNIPFALYDIHNLGLWA